MRLGLGLALTDFGTKGGVSDTPDLSGSLASVLLAAYGGYGLSFDFTETPSAKISDSGTPANNYDSSGTITSGALVGPGGKITYTSPSAKNTLQSDGYIYRQAHNLYLNSASPADQAVTVTSGATYRMTITGSVSITVSGAATGTYTAGDNDFTAASGTLTCGSTSGSGTVHLRRTPSVSAYLATGASAVYDLPYIHSSGVKTGILDETAATNLDTTSQTLTSFSTLYLSIGAGALTSPLTTTAVKLTEDTTPTERHILYVLRSASAAAHTFWVMAHASARDFVCVGMREQTGADGYSALFNLATGSLVSTQTVGAGLTSTNTHIQSLGNGWYLCGVTGAHASATGYYTELGSSDSASPSFSSGMPTYTGASADAIEIGHVQFELGSAPTSAIQTYGSTVTRNADNPTVATSLFPWSATVDSMMVLYVPGSASTELQPIYLTDGTANEVIALGNTSGGAPQLKVVDGGAAQTAPLTDGTVTANGTEKLAAKVKANAFLLSDNGAAAVSDTSGTLPTVTTLRLGGQAGSMLIKQILIVPVDYDATAIAGMATQ